MLCSFLFYAYQKKKHWSVDTFCMAILSSFDCMPFYDSIDIVLVCWCLWWFFWSFSKPRRIRELISSSLKLSIKVYHALHSESHSNNISCLLLWLIKSIRYRIMWQKSPRFRLFGHICWMICLHLSPPPPPPSSLLLFPKILFRPSAYFQLIHYSHSLLLADSQFVK